MNLLKGVMTVTNYDNTMKMKLDIGEWIQQQIFFFGYYDERGMKCLKKYLNKGDVFIDIGANVGCYSLIASKIVTETGKVYAFEPVNSIYNCLKKNVELNNLKNIVLEKKAIYNKRGVKDLYISLSDNMGMSSISTPVSNYIEKVNTITLDEFIRNNKVNKVDFIKIDIEGAELYALQGMTNTIIQNKPVIIVELNEWILKETGIDMKDIIKLMQKLGYSMKAINKDGIIIDKHQLSDNSDYNNRAFIYDKFILSKKGED